jgi:hypothetical protein
MVNLLSADVFNFPTTGIALMLARIPRDGTSMGLFVCSVKNKKPPLFQAGAFA